MVFLRALFLIIFLGGITIGIQAQELETPGNQAFSDKFFRLALQEIHDVGPTTETAHFLARNIDLIWTHKEELLKTIAPYLSSTDEMQCGAALRVIHVMRGESTRGINLSWQFQTAENRQELQIQLDDLILSNLNRLLQLKNSESLHKLAQYLGSSNLPEFKSALHKLVTNPQVSEQALICLTWHQDPADMDFLLPFMLQEKPGASSLPYLFITSYGPASWPYLKRVVNHSVLTRTRFEAAKYLILENQLEGFHFLIKVLSQNPIKTTCGQCQFLEDIGKLLKYGFGYKEDQTNQLAMLRFLTFTAKSIRQQRSPSTIPQTGIVSSN